MKSIIFFLVFFWLSTAFATHNMSGYISYSHISGLTYKITAVTFTNNTPNSADRPVLGITYGDGSPIDSIIRTSRKSGNYGFGSSYKNIYVGQHTYTTNGKYTIALEDPNRSIGLLNVSNSIDQAFYISCTLDISGQQSNNSPIFYGIEPFGIPAGSIFTLNLAAFDPDGDFLSYGFVPAKADSGNPLLGYILPPGATINNETGEFRWDTPNQIGLFLFSIEIAECRDGKQIGSVTYDMVVDISSNIVEPKFADMSNWQQDAKGNYILNAMPNQPINLTLSFEDVMADSIQFVAMGQPLSVSNANFQINSTIGNLSLGNFTWTPSTSNHSCAPYMVTFRGYSFVGGFQYSQDLTLSINIQDPTKPCSSPCYLIQNVADWSVRNKVKVTLAPNPLKEYSIINVSENDLEYSAILISDLRGNIVIRLLYNNSNQYIIQRNDLSNGVYFVSVEVSGSQILESKKLIVIN